MKCSTLCVTVMTAFIAGVTWADLQTPVGVLVNESLDRFGYTSRNPVPDEIWELKSPCMKVLQVVEGGVLVDRIASAANAKNFYVKTSRTYADGDVFATGYYRAAGTVSYTSILGAGTTVYAFSELSTSQQRQLAAFIQDKEAVAAAKARADEERRKRAEQTEEFKKSKERIAAEEEAEKERLERERVDRENAQELEKLNAEKDKRVAAIKAKAEAEANRAKAEHADEMARLAREREEQDRENRKLIAAAKAEKVKADANLAVEIQKERGRYAADVLSALDFNFKHHYIVQNSIRKNVTLEIIDPLWSNLAELQLKQDWMGMLGAMKDDECDEFPPEKEIDRAIEELKKRLFTIKITATGRPPNFVEVWAGRVKDRFCEYNGYTSAGERWMVKGQPISCVDPVRDRRIQKRGGEHGEASRQVDLLAGKFYVGRDNGRKPVLLSGRSAVEKSDSSLEDLIAETEEWLKSN